MVLEIRIYLSRKRTVLRASVTVGAHGSVGGGGLLGDRASGVTPLPPVRAGRPSAAQAHRVRHRRLELRLLVRRRLAPREDLRALRRLRTGALPASLTGRLTVRFFNSAVRC